MMFVKLIIFIIIMFIVILPNGDCKELGEIYDAVFSPDGNKIGVGTETGFYIYDRVSLKLEFSLPTPNGVHFIRWSPDGTKIFLSLWMIKDNEWYEYPSTWSIETTYWIYDLNHKSNK